MASMLSIKRLYIPGLSSDPKLHSLVHWEYILPSPIYGLRYFAADLFIQSSIEDDRSSVGSALWKRAVEHSIGSEDALALSRRWWVKF